MLTVFSARSQDTTDLRPVQLPFWMAREVALDLREKVRLEQEAQISSLQLSRYQNLVEGLEQNIRNTELQLELMRKRKELLESQLKVERKKRPGNKIFPWLLRMFGALGVGFVLGRL